tara:strand:- start:479 stop:649 length:171 start_codon:yes stop_codon:yes gene_type:complete
LAAIAEVLPGFSIDYYLGELPYAQGLQLQTISMAKQGIEFEAPFNGPSFEEIAGFS